MRITFVELPRDEVLAQLGPHWPARPGATVALIGEAVAVTHGAVAIHTTDGQPGRTWWAVDGLIVPQDAGPLPDLPGCPVATVPDPAPATPPLT
ncbi:hypothetical protein DIZ27_23095 [Streptomyces sp. NWU339]|uniref:hypothetical protein n=1 Tax=Streptomyces sp. NWU339 TaxID=2185284 RepID=UPI000D677FDE|nr:hypothetical protein [Streptomyces sp. NWU339]PWI08328.1 hypothetical protein DIZ27_23095 [Streptomyces sp. NWU339]